MRFIKNKTKFFKTILFISILFFTQISFNANAANWKNIVKNYGKTVCIIKIYDKGESTPICSGSGFLISSNGKILTNAHVVNSAYYDKSCRIEVNFLYPKKLNKTYSASIKHFVKDLDISILKIKGRFNKYCKLGHSKNTAVMDEILVMGYPLGKNFKVTPGYIQSFQNLEELGQMIDINVSLDPGNSGGPIFDSRGRVIGIATAKYINLNFNFAIPIDIITFYLKNYKKIKPVAIISNPSGARIFINGNYKGTTPLNTKIYLKKSTIKVEKDNYIQQKKDFIVYPYKRKKIFFELVEDKEDIRQVVITTTPPGVMITVDNKRIGKSPVKFTVKGETMIRVLIKKFGYKDYFKSILIKNKKKNKIHIKLKSFF